jgi:hypothetical protein
MFEFLDGVKESFVAMFPMITAIVIYSFLGIIFAVIVGYFAWYMTFSRIIVIKERIGKEFNYDLTSRDVEEQPANKGSLFGDINNAKNEEEEKEGTKVIKAIQTVSKTYKGKIIKRKGRYYIALFRFLAPTLKLKHQGAEFWSIAGNKRKLEMLKLTEHLYAPILMIYDGNAYSKAIYDENYIAWVHTDIEDDHRKFKENSFWDKYGGWVMTVTTMLVCLIFVIVVFRNLQPFADAGRAGAEALANSCIAIMEQNVK